MTNHNRYDWLAVRNGLIYDVGFGESYRKYLDKAGAVLDAKGATVLPGFIDSHFHVVQAAINSASVDLSGAQSFDDIGALISEAAKNNEDKVIRGIRLDEQSLKENRLPDRNVLDKYCQDKPVFINTVEYQKSALNTYALFIIRSPSPFRASNSMKTRCPRG
jgi:predicted amidohydrolase YtcJ